MPNQTIRAAEYMPTRASFENKPYVHQAFPSTRYHKDGRVQLVDSPKHEQDTCPASEGWSKSPVDVPAAPAPTAPTSGSDLKVLLQSLAEENGKLSGENARLSAELHGLRAQLAAAAQAKKKNSGQFDKSAASVEAADEKES